MADTQATAVAPSELDNQITQFKTNMGLVHQLVHGDKDTAVITEGGPIPTFAKLAAEIAKSLVATSTSVRQAQLGQMVFDIEAGKSFGPGQWVVAEAEGVELTGRIESYVGTTLTIDVARVDGEGTFNAWNIGVSGPIGIQGIQGDQGNDAYEVAVEGGYDGTRQA